MSNDLNIYFSQENVQMETIYPICRELQIKTTVRYPTHLLEWPKSKTAKLSSKGAMPFCIPQQWMRVLLLHVLGAFGIVSVLDLGHSSR